MIIQEMRALSQEELAKQLDESYRELFNLRFRLATRQLTNYNEIRNVIAIASGKGGVPVELHGQSFQKKLLFSLLI